MQKERRFTGCLKENKKRRHAEILRAANSASSTKVVSQGNDNGVRGRSQIRFGMAANFNNGGFTLIELLVVVLIIGILAAVALPQYQTAVAKTRTVQLVTLANAVKQAQERYYLANGQYTTDWTELDIELDGTINGTKLSNSAGWALQLMPLTSSAWEAVWATDTRLPIAQLIFSYDNATGVWKGKRLCYAALDNKLANILCRNISNLTRPSGNNRGTMNYYVF